MNVKSDKLNCYIEGIRIPISNFKIEYRRNILPTAMVTVAIGEQIVPKSWAMALVQVTYIANAKEHLLFDGVCYSLDIDEQTGYLIVSLISKWEVLNLNSALDYTSPKKYGIQNIEDGVMIYLGNEESVELTTTQTEGGLLSNRYYFLKESSRDIFDMDPNDSETHKLEYIVNRVPFAERFARVFFDDIIMQNFTLSQAHVERLNLLNKVGKDTKRALVLQDSTDDVLIQTLQYQITLDPSRTGIFFAEGLIIPSDSGATPTPNGSYSSNALLNKVINVATTQLGKVEEPQGSDSGPDVTKYLQSVGLGPGNPWCMSFVYWCFDTAAKELKTSNPAVQTGGVLDHWSSTSGKKITTSQAMSNPSLVKPGQIFIKTRVNGGHAGLVESVNGTSINTIEGNTGRSGVTRVTRNISSISEGFIEY